MLLGTAAAGAFGYGVSRYLGSKSKNAAENSENQLESEAAQDVGILRSECPECGKPVKEYEFFCPYCGHTPEKCEEQAIG